MDSRKQKGKQDFTIQSGPVYTSSSTGVRTLVISINAQYTFALSDQNVFIKRNDLIDCFTVTVCWDSVGLQAVNGLLKYVEISIGNMTF